MKKLLIFDAYGTLFSTGTGSVDAAAKILTLQPKPIDPQVFYRQWKQLHRIHMDESNQSTFLRESSIFEKDLAVLYRRWKIIRDPAQDVQIMLQSLTGRKLYPDVAKTIAHLRTRYRVVIGSTTDTAPLMHNLALEKLLVDGVYTSEIVQKYKPHPEFYRHILAAENCRPEQAVFIGDSLTDDVQGPAALGISTIWLNRKNAILPQHIPTPDHILHNLLSFPPFV